MAAAKGTGNLAADEFFAVAMEHRQKGQLEEAIFWLTKLVDEDSDNDQARYTLAEVYLQNGQDSQAYAGFRQLLDRSQENPEALLHLGAIFMAGGRIEDAIKAFAMADTCRPGNVAIIHNLGTAYYHIGELASAQQYFQRVLAIDRSYFQSLFNLGLICYEEKNYSEAVSYYKKAWGEQPDDGDLNYNLGLALLKINRLEEAASHLEKALLELEEPELFNTLGTVYNNLGQHERAVDCYEEALALNPEYGVAYANMGIVMQTLEDTEGAIFCFTKAMELGHEPVAAQFMLNALQGEKQEQAPLDYIKNLYDGYADRFDESLTKALGYDTPAQIRTLIKPLLPASRLFGRSLDLGCGTGLSGEQIRDISEYLCGVDISGEMLDKAREKDYYDDLYERDIIGFLADSRQPYDLIVAADVLLYLGGLEEFFAGICRCTEQGGLLVFSTEDTDEAEDYILQKNGRYAHARGYIERLAEGQGFFSEFVKKAELRKERGTWINGYIYCFRKSQA